MRFHHIDIPTSEPKQSEVYGVESRLHITSMDDHPHHVEWLHFESGSPLPQIIQDVPHVAFGVRDPEKAIAGKDVLIQPKTTANGQQIAFIIEGGGSR